MFSTFNRNLLFVGAALLAAACQSETTMISHSISTQPAADPAVPLGPVYFLPKTTLKVEGAPCLVPAPAKKEEKKEKAENPDTVVNVNVSATSTSTAKAPNDGKPDANGTPDSSGDKCKPEDPEAAYGFKVTTLTLADPANGYQTSFPLAKFSSDKPVIKINSGGLLSSATAVSQDETRESLVKYGEVVGNIVGLQQAILSSKLTSTFKGLTLDLPTFADIGAQGRLDALKVAPKPRIVAFCDLGALANSWTWLCKTSEGDGSITISTVGATSATGSSCEADSGLCFRSRSRHLLQIKANYMTNAALTTPVPFSKTVEPLEIIDPYNNYTVTPIRRPFVQAETKLIFDNGVLTEFDGDYPSTGGAILSFPADFISGVFTGITGAFTQRTSAATKEIELLKAQTDLEAARLALQEAKDKSDEEDTAN